MPKPTEHFQADFGWGRTKLEGIASLKFVRRLHAGPATSSTDPKSPAYVYYMVDECGGDMGNLICEEWRMFLNEVLMCSGKARYLVGYFNSLQRFRSAADTNRNWMWA